MKAIAIALIILASCTPKREANSDDRQRAQQERMLAEGTSQVGMPAIKNFRERRLLKTILEMRDQEDLNTTTYTYSEVTGKFTFFCDSIGYGIPYATQFTNPQKLDSDWNERGFGLAAIAQADPNGLFSPASADGTWILCKDPGGTEIKPVYVEPKITTTPFRLPFAEGQVAERPAPPAPSAPNRP